MVFSSHTYNLYYPHLLYGLFAQYQLTIVASPCHSAFTLPNALAPTFPLVGAFSF
jgi:hypothetical protein